MTIKPVKRLIGEIKVQGDKSVSHRAIILGSIASGVTTVTDFLPSDDCRATMNAFRAMGVSIEDNNGSTVKIEGKNLYGLIEPADVMDMVNSGTSARLLCASPSYEEGGSSFKEHGCKYPGPAGWGASSACH